MKIGDLVEFVMVEDDNPVNRQTATLFYKRIKERCGSNRGIVVECHDKNCMVMFDQGEVLLPRDYLVKLSTDETIFCSACECTPCDCDWGYND